MVVAGWYDEQLKYVANEEEIAKLLPFMRAKSYTESIPLEQRQLYVNDGWTVIKEFKKTVKIAKPKSHDDIFEDYVWVLFASMGFKFLSKDRHKFELQISSDDKKQIDVFGIDDNVVVIAECKSAETPKTKKEFRNEIDHIKNYKSQIPKYLNNHFAGYKPRYVFLFCTENFEVSKEDQDRLRASDIFWFDKKKIDYYMELVSQIGVLCKYQFFGEILQGKDVPGMKNVKIPAIKSKMGKYTCYSMMVNPQILLQISYVLHRSENVEMQGTYQRYVKKGRINKIKDYVEAGGYFPNSIIINFENNLYFEPAPIDYQDGGCGTIGRLQLPSKYRSAFIIDGQHRLYGYAGAKNVENAVIPVVAFEQVSPEDQTNMFVDINNKAVSVKRSLIESLNCELYWNSPNPKYALSALRSMLAIKLTNDPSSPLHECISIGEKIKSDSSKITLSYFIDNGIRNQRYFVKEFHKNGNPLVFGPLYDGDLADNSLNKAFHVFSWFFSEIKRNCTEQWEYMLKNVIICSLSEMLHEFLDEYDNKHADCPLIGLNAKIIEAQIQRRVDELCLKIASKSAADIDRYQDSSYGYGGVGKTKRYFEEMIHEIDDSYCPDGLEKWISEKSGQYRSETEKMIEELSDSIVSRTKELLIREHGENYILDLPENVIVNVKRRSSKAIDLEDVREIALSDWKDCFDVLRDKSKTKGDKNDRTQYLIGLVKIRDTIRKEGTITEEQYSFAKHVYKWYFEQED